ncbi:MAG TPA: hypothetical protein PK280_11285 [Planctomycetota bacterium]|nr:hypothetical protein [Planctomycetota bacterium]
MPCEWTSWINRHPREDAGEPIIEKAQIIQGGKTLTVYKPIGGKLRYAAVPGAGRVRLEPGDRALRGIELSAEIPAIQAVLEGWLKSRTEMVLFAARGVPIPNAGSTSLVLLPGRKDYVAVERFESGLYALGVVPVGEEDATYPHLTMKVTAGPHDAAKVFAVSGELDLLLGRDGAVLGRFGVELLRKHFGWPWDGCLGGGAEPVGNKTLACLLPVDVQAFFEAAREAMSMGRG